MAMSTYDHLDEGTLESRVRMWRPAIEYCFKKSDVVTKLAQHGLLDAEETAKLIELYDLKPSQDASSEMFNILFRKRVPKRKWKTFVDAIEEAGKLLLNQTKIKISQNEVPLKVLKFIMLISMRVALVAIFIIGYTFAVSRLINERVEIAEERERGKQLLLMFGPFFEIDVNPSLLIDQLLDRKIIKEEDADKIRNTTHTKSKAEGMRILLQRIQCYMEPRKWWQEFLTVLWETEFEHMALLLEPEYFPTSEKLGTCNLPVLFKCDIALIVTRVIVCYCAPTARASRTAQDIARKETGISTKDTVIYQRHLKQIRKAPTTMIKKRTVFVLFVNVLEPRGVHNVKVRRIARGYAKLQTGSVTNRSANENVRTNKQRR